MNPLDDLVIPKPSPPKISRPVLVLVGPPGSGKSTIGRSLAQVLNVAYRDTDDVIVATARRTIPEIFDQDGEAAFREMESVALSSTLNTHSGVLSLGGGTPVASINQDLLAEYAAAGGTVVFLDVSMEDVLRRIGDNHGRPLLDGNPAEKFNSLMQARRPIYERVANVHINTSPLTPDEVVTVILDNLNADSANANVADTEATRITVTAERTYDVVVGRHLLGELAGLLGTGVNRVLVIHPESLEATADAVREDLLAQGYEALLAVVPDAEESKTAQVLAFCWQILGQSDFTRTDAIVSIGGGATTDLAGLVAATWLRGIKIVHIPTTLLAMVDAAVGGKAAINTAEGKNLVGAFYSPHGVLCDLDSLQTLPRWDLIAGLAEVIKTGFIADPVILDLVEANSAALKQWPESRTPELDAVLRELIERSVAVKAKVVSEDLREASLREILNYGHTFGHAIEQVERYQWRHGAAVSVGMVFAAELARLAGKLSDDVADRHRSILAGVGLPITYRGDRWEKLLAAMQRDKKTRGALLRFVTLDDIATPTRLEGPDPTLLAAAYAEISADAPRGVEIG